MELAIDHRVFSPSVEDFSSSNLTLPSYFRCRAIIYNNFHTSKFYLVEFVWLLLFRDIKVPFVGEGCRYMCVPTNSTTSLQYTCNASYEKVLWFWNSWIYYGLFSDLLIWKLVNWLNKILPRPSQLLNKNNNYIGFGVLVLTIY